jgi:hypothetical protein
MMSLAPSSNTGGLASTAGFVLARGGPLGAPFFAHVYTAAIGIAVLRTWR